VATARHPKATSFVQRRFFSGLSIFAELEQKIAALPDEESRGDAFEVFAEAYLATQRKHDASQVWPHGSVPLDTLKNLGLSQQDQGVDGVLQTLLGEFDAYQVKFRAGRPSLTWRELSTFIGLADSPRIHSRVLLTNCDELPAVLNDRHGFFCIRGADLDRMEGEDFRAIEAWLADAVYTPPKKTPQTHQTEALGALVPALQTHDRVSAIMACGTGKTLVALWLAESLAWASSPAGCGGVPAARILVLLPSLALLRQTLHEWLRETSLPSLAYLCVCSDPTVKEGLDALATPQSDLDFQVSTDAASVRRFLDAPFAGVKLVFSTYQSASVVGAALLPGEAFDLAVFDEAHKTAGREGRNFALALDDKNLAIRKRLFLTATPRHYNPHDRDREGEARLLFSMDNPVVYGPQFYRLTFAEAARREIICGYKVIISVITSEMVTNELLSRGEVLVNGNAVRARQAANQIALRDAIEKYGVKKVFTFHRDVKSAQSFVSDGPEGVGTHLNGGAGFQPAGLGGIPATSSETTGKDACITRTQDACATFQMFHVNGSMPTARRECELRDFRAAARAVVSNARCLTEGVDVPAVDMVAFLSPRRSRVDIVQATGRAMRRSPGKTTGYVLVPLYVELTAGETVEAAVNRARFDEVWDVLQSLQEQDEVLAEIIREMRQQKGRTKGFDDSRFLERVEILGPRLSLESLSKAIVTMAVANLTDNWWERFGELIEFRRQHGDCRVPNKYKPNQQLATWVNTQRQFYSRQQLSVERIKRLQEVGFEWDIAAAYWERMFAALAAYKQKHGDCRVPARYKPDQQLATWVNTQRNTFIRRQLPGDLIKRLEQVGFEWDPQEADWERMFAVLIAYKQKHGNCGVPDEYKLNKKLATWVGTQRQFYSRQQLSADRIRRLEEVGFEWSAQATAWERMFAALAAFKQEHGDCRIPQTYKPNQSLAKWVNRQRGFYAQHKLSTDRIGRLEQLGFEWNRFESAWEQMFAALAAYKQEHGDCRVPQEYKLNTQLASWVSRQRGFYAQRKLSTDRIGRLEQLGFEWNRFESAWEQMFAALAAYKQEHGDCRVPQKYKSNPQLGQWVSTQRRRRDSIPIERRQRLDALGFV
jgi:superfamily II DNA or RNA helicase